MTTTATAGERIHGHKVHDRLPSGFSIANGLQETEYNVSGSVHGAAKVCFVSRMASLGNMDFPVTDLAVRLRPPRTLEDIRSNLGVRGMLDAVQYRLEYEKGWARAKRTSEYPSGSYAQEDGYLDSAAGRAKWHLTYCSNHDACGEA